MHMVSNNMISIESMFLVKLQSHAMIKTIKSLPVWFWTPSGSVWDHPRVPWSSGHLTEPNLKPKKVSAVNIWKWPIKHSIQQLQSILLVWMVSKTQSHIQELLQFVHTMTIINLAHTMATGKKLYFQILGIITRWEMVFLKFTLQRLVLTNHAFQLDDRLGVFLKTIKRKKWKGAREFWITKFQIQKNFVKINALLWPWWLLANARQISYH